MKKRDRFICTLLVFTFLIIIKAGNVAAEYRTSWKFAVISDTQEDSSRKRSASCIKERILKLIASDIAANTPDFVLVTGDLVNGWIRNSNTDYAAQYSSWKMAMKPVYSAGIKVYSIRGNHDYGPERYVTNQLKRYPVPPPDSLLQMENEYKRIIIESYIPLNGPVKEQNLTYSFIHKNANFICLDQYALRQHRINQQWLNRQLAENTQAHLFVFGHEPAFESDYLDNLSYYPEDRDIFWDSIGMAGARIYFCGHDHYYNRALIHDSRGNPVWQITAGSGGGKIQKWSGRYFQGDRAECNFHSEDFFGYVLVTIDGMNVRVEWRAVTNASSGTWHVLDEFSYSAAPIELY